ncbi:hypothetical protein [Nitrosomonas supralitoralis]|nr:hypothetical protein [Nitrosomonas supralitoralis]
MTKKSKINLFLRRIAQDKFKKKKGNKNFMFFTAPGNLIAANFIENQD